MFYPSERPSHITELMNIQNKEKKYLLEF